MRYLTLIALTFCAFSTIVVEARWFPDFCRRPTPWPLEEIRPELHVFTRWNTRVGSIGNETEMIRFVDALEKDGLIRASRQVIYIVHGYLGWMPWTRWIDEIRDVLLEATDCTVVVVSWANGADVFYSYGDSASNTQTVAKFLSDFSHKILFSPAFDGDVDKLYLHCIGHSLGSHVCGQAGRLSRIFDRATGLDPAGPGFDSCPNDDRLHIDEDSAACVDNIHTDGLTKGHWLPLVPNFGTLKSWGHVDFYPNGGGNQPGCWFNDVPPCSHSAAIQFYIYTIRRGPGVCLANGTCDDVSDLPNGCANNATQPMGYYSSCHSKHKRVIPGNFYITTGKKEQYC